MIEILERFSAWCRQKVEMHTTPREPPPLFKQGEVWWCSIGLNVGNELFGKGEQFSRPVLIVRKFSSNTFLGLPLTLQEKSGTYFVETTLGGVRRWVILSQARTMDARRLLESVGTLDAQTFNKIRDQLCKLIIS